MVHLLVVRDFAVFLLLLIDIGGFGRNHGKPVDAHPSTPQQDGDYGTSPKGYSS